MVAENSPKTLAQEPMEKASDNKSMPIKDVGKVIAWQRHLKQNYGLKQYLFVKIGFDTGANPSQIIKLKYADLQREPSRIPIGCFDYYFLFPSTLFADQVKRYILPDTVESLRELKEQNPSDIYIFQTASNNKRNIDSHWCRNHPIRFLSKSAKEVGITENVGMLTLRKSYGYHVVVNGNWTLRELQRHFEYNHSITRLKEYIGITDEKVFTTRAKQ